MPALSQCCSSESIIIPADHGSVGEVCADPDLKSKITCYISSVDVAGKTLKLRTGTAPEISMLIPVITDRALFS